MIERVKNFFAGLASVTALLYLTGYICEHAHAKMLGITIIAPTKDYYLIVGGKFLLSTLYALYSGLLPQWYLFATLFIFILALRFYEAHAKKKDSYDLPVWYVVVAGVLAISLVIAIQFFTRPFLFSDFLISQSANLHNFTRLDDELRSWVLNDNPYNIAKLMRFYIKLLLATVFYAVILFAFSARWRRMRDHKIEIVTTKKTDLIIRHIFQLITVAIAFSVIILMVTIPGVYGILIQSNDYPEVVLDIKKEKIKTDGKEALQPALKLLENQDTAKPAKLWLLWKNDSHLILYAVYYKKSRQNPISKIMEIKRELINKLEITGYSHVFSFK